MRLLMIATGFPPRLFSENICNGKLVMALKRQGIEVDVISRIDDGPSYGADWCEPWMILKDSTYPVKYPLGNKLQRSLDIIRSGISLGWIFLPGVRWARRAYETAMKLIAENQYDAILTRSPSDISHHIGYKLHKKTGIKWIANWNDPADPIWPGIYANIYSPRTQKRKMQIAEMLLRSADVNTFPSNSLRQHFISHFPFLNNQTTGIIPHIGLLEEFFPKATSTKVSNKLRFLHSGNMTGGRNPEKTFQAMRVVIDGGFNDFEFHCMGQIDECTKALIEKYSLADYVKFIGSRPYMEALSIMQDYDVLVLLEADLEKGIFFASKVSDYLETGLPILAISPREGFAADLLTGAKHEYVADNTDSNSILDALKHIIKDWKNNSLRDNDSPSLYKKLAPEEVVKKLKHLI